ncbi:SMI1/KNR4 family protein [Enterovibrio norvegicus]|uniref:SMI1/KNR4 family protein n=1 Tax=Enterovibrio norvegicus TaxID=188144 RepID=UPI00352FC267
MEPSRKTLLIDAWKNEAHRPEAAPDRLSTLEDVAEFESSYSVVLPETFKAFLIDCGASSFNDQDWQCSVFDLNVGEHKVRDMVTHNYIFNVKQISDSLFELNEELPDFWETEAPLIPPQMIPIADSLSRDRGFLLMNVSEKHYGTLWHWRFIQEAWGDKDNNMLLEVSVSFDSWLDAMKSWDEAEALIAQQDKAEKST